MKNFILILLNILAITLGKLSSYLFHFYFIINFLKVIENLLKLKIQPNNVNFKTMRNRVE